MVSSKQGIIRSYFQLILNLGKVKQEEHRGKSPVAKILRFSRHNNSHWVALAANKI